MFAIFAQFLINKERLQEKYVPFYVKWVADCYRQHNLPETKPLTNDQRAQFLKRLADNAEDWQVKQAERALRLYDFFLLQKMKTETGDVSGQAADWLYSRGKNPGSPQAASSLPEH